MGFEEGNFKGRNYYEVLGVGVDADEKAIKSAFRRIARETHPDQNSGDPAAEERFKELNEAYETLGDPAKRETYDRGSKQPNFPEAPSVRRSTRISVEDIFRVTYKSPMDELKATVSADFPGEGRYGSGFGDALGGPSMIPGLRDIAMRHPEMHAEVEATIDRLISNRLASIMEGISRLEGHWNTSKIRQARYELDILTAATGRSFEKERAELDKNDQRLKAQRR